MQQGNHDGGELGGLAVTALLVIAGVAVIFSKFSLSTLVACIQAPYTAAFRAFSDSLKFTICGLTSKSFGINSSYESLKIC